MCDSTAENTSKSTQSIVLGRPKLTTVLLYKIENHSSETVIIIVFQDTTRKILNQPLVALAQLSFLVSLCVLKGLLFDTSLRLAMSITITTQTMTFDCEPRRQVYAHKAKILNNG